jgi:hypothetical protein
MICALWMRLYEEVEVPSRLAELRERRQSIEILASAIQAQRVLDTTLRRGGSKVKNPHGPAMQRDG